MIQDYIKFITDDYKIPHTVLPFGTDGFILIMYDGGLYTEFYVNEKRWINVGSFEKNS